MEVQSALEMDRLACNTRAWEFALVTQNRDPSTVAGRRIGNAMATTMLSGGGRVQVDLNRPIGPADFDYGVPITQPVCRAALIEAQRCWQALAAQRRAEFGDDVYQFQPLDPVQRCQDMDLGSGLAKGLKSAFSSSEDKPAAAAADTAEASSVAPSPLPPVTSVNLAPVAGARAIAPSLDPTPSTNAGLLAERLYLLAIGINRYAAPDIPRLDYAVADARAIDAAFRRMQGVLFKEVHTQLLTDDGGTPPTADNIRDQLGFLRKAGEGDVAMLFLAGHGVAQDGEYYLLGSNGRFEEDGSVKASTAILMADLERVMKAGNARTVVFIDTCRAGAVSFGGNIRAVNRGLSPDLLRSLTAAGTTVLMAAKENEDSRELDRYGHGAFTHAILDALASPASDSNHDGYLSMVELQSHVIHTVIDLTGGRQHPVTDHFKNNDLSYPVWKFPNPGK